MFKNYFKTAIRNFGRNKLFAIINILGLSIGISASLVIYLLVDHEFKFDTFHKDGDRIFRIVSKFSFQGETFYNSGVTYPLGEAVKNEVTGLEQTVAFSTWDNDTKVSVADQNNSNLIVHRKQKNIVFADSHYFRLIHYMWLSGSPETSLQRPYQVVLTEQNASLYFPKLSATEIVGKEIVFNDTVRTTITGVVKDISRNTDFSFKTFISKPTEEILIVKQQDLDNWGTTNSSSQLMIKLAEGSTQSQIQKQLAALYLKYNKPKPEEKNKVPYLLQPLNDIHFNSNYGAFDNRLAHKPTLYGLLCVAAFLLILGCINFINLTTAQSTYRIKETGIRKTMGGTKMELVVQFLTETLLLTLIATLLSIVLTPFLLKVFSDFIPNGLQFDLIEEPGLLIFLAALIITVTLLAGFYPAWILSSYTPALILKNQAWRNSGKTRSSWMRKTLTVSQFAIAQVFIMGAMLVGSQISYTLNKDLGFKKDAIIYFQTNFYDTVASRKQVLLEKLHSMPEIAMVSLSNNPIASNGTWSNTLKYKDGNKEIETNVQMKMGDSNYVKLYGLKLLAGENFRQTDTITEFVINETYANMLGFEQPEQAIGKYIEWNERPVPITGVVADFHQQSLHAPIKPIAIGSWKMNLRTFNIALQSETDDGLPWKSVITKIEQAFKEVYPDDDFEYSFQDETIAKYYAAEQKISSLLKWATGLAIFISCLGLLGLVIYTTNQRTKEIGLRKVLGASATQIVTMISKEFVLLVLIAFSIATPLAWIGINKWLENFAYKTSINWLVFIYSGSLMLVIALLILAFQTIKAALANPVKSLRNE